MMDIKNENFDQSRSWIDIEWVKPMQEVDETNPATEAFIENFRKKVEALDLQKQLSIHHDAAYK